MKLCKSEIETRKPKFENYKIYWQMFFTFVRIGSFTFGGGYAMIPLIQEEVVKKRKWID